MAFIDSLLFNNKTCISLGTIRIEIKKSPEGIAFNNDHSLSLFDKAAQCVLRQTAFKTLSLSTLHLVVHELGHAVAQAIYLKKPVKIEIYSDITKGYSIPDISEKDIFDAKDYGIMAAAGPITNAAFSTLKIAAAIHFQDVIPNAIENWMIISSLIWLVLETAYAIDSTSKKNEGDFGQIAKYVPDCLNQAILILACEVFLGCILAMDYYLL